jgi:hypothetical protein
VIDQESTHGTYLNGQKLVAYVPAEVRDGDCIALGTVLEATGRTSEHLPTELEIGIQRVQIPITLEMSEVHAATTTATTNSFHAPSGDSESEVEGDDLDNNPIRLWKPFAMTSTLDVEIIDPPTVTIQNAQIEESFVREHSTSTSVNGEHTTTILQPLLPPPATILDLMSDNPWVEAEPVQIECIEIHSDDGEYDEDDNEDDYDDDYEDEYDDEFGYGYDDEDPSDFKFPYEYDTDDKESVNEENEITETQVFPRMESPSIIVTPILYSRLIIG